MILMLLSVSWCKDESWIGFTHLKVSIYAKFVGSTFCTTSPFFMSLHGYAKPAQCPWSFSSLKRCLGFFWHCGSRRGDLHWCCALSSSAGDVFVLIVSLRLKSREQTKIGLGLFGLEPTFVCPGLLDATRRCAFCSWLGAMLLSCIWSIRSRIISSAQFSSCDSSMPDCSAWCRPLNLSSFLMFFFCSDLRGCLNIISCFLGIFRPPPYLNSTIPCHL